MQNYFWFGYVLFMSSVWMNAGTTKKKKKKKKNAHLNRGNTKRAQSVQVTSFFKQQTDEI